ncbi:3'-5' exonuclease [Tamlana sp. 2_MG-2023]|uniref:3'-5' exonuclease n=1 Tax=unclassified Tamlana TaxID=2614803 RepID=UPI0026E3EFBF|nr:MULTISPECIES: 3'-5' exonuclease [unclassified Tamlana]MDO6759234.1 3'-5' exonuclease [Tamlana sp. 2_MG-2023]MDO6790627.1 3'-5' exonuclease [Tamlana sp. 1_MG-2023]
MKLFSWFLDKKSDHPDFWLEYLEGFKGKMNKNIQSTRFVAFDTETTGFDFNEDRVLSIGAVSFIDKKIEVSKSLELYIKQDVFKAESVKIHGLLKNSKVEKQTELEAIKSFLAYIKSDVLIAHHANFDRNMINKMLERHGLGKLKNKFIDTGHLFKKSVHLIYKDEDQPFTLDELAKELNVPLVDRHTATGDALITALIFLKTLSRLDKRKHLNWGYLLPK